jgi:hypothetical protein
VLCLAPGLYHYIVLLYAHVLCALSCDGGGGGVFVWCWLGDMLPVIFGMHYRLQLLVTVTSILPTSAAAGAAVGSISAVQHSAAHVACIVLGLVRWWCGGGAAASQTL